MAKSKYLQIAQLLIDEIENGQLAPHVKLPSLRTLMALHTVSMTTAIASYRYMEQLGYAVAEEKKGFYTQKPYPATNMALFPQFNSAIVKVAPRPAKNNIDIATDSLATAKLDTRLIDISFLKQSINAAMKSADFNLNYEAAQGNVQLRHQLSNHFSQQGFTSHQGELVITNGCLDAVVIALETVSKPGDVIAISSPCYSGLLDILSLLDRAIIEIPSTEHGIDLEQLSNIAKTNNIAACILTANYQNPTGHSLSNEQKKLVAELASKYELPIIEDDIFRELAHQKTIPLPIKYYDKAGWVLWCSSFSKTLAPGLRLGWCKPGRFLAKYLNRRKIQTLGINQPMQLALADYVGKGHYARHLKKVNKALSLHCTTYLDYLQKHLPSNSQIYFPKGGLVLWINIPNVDAEKLALYLSNQGVSIQQGNTFSTTTLYQNCIRINIGLIPEKSLMSQLKAIVLAIDELE